MIGDGNDKLVVDGTPGFTGRIRYMYMRSSSAVIYIFIGECQSVGSHHWTRLDV